jgi:UDP-N-acetylmuramoyl-tripeptide--D-alanyl-D-alanine ligase
MKKLLFTYLKFWATGYLKRTNPRIIAITGSVGKTSTKEAIFEVLKIKYGKNVRKSEGNLNNETGTPLAILGYLSSPNNYFAWLPVLISAPFRSFFFAKVEFLVLELAADKPGDIKYLTAFIHPEIAVLTSIGPAHLEAFGKIENIIEEKTNLLRALPSDGWAVLNVDDEHVKKVSYGGRWKKKTYAIKENADFKAKNIRTEIVDFKAKTFFDVALTKITNVTQNTLGLYSNVLASLAAVTVGKILEIPEEAIVEGLQNVVSEKHRLNVLAGIKQSIIIDDSYNANPLSMKAALDILNELPRKGGRKIAVLGDMLEIGDISKEAHELIGKYAKEVSDIVVSVGGISKTYNAKKHFHTAEIAGEYLLNNVKKNDIILIKGSRKIGLDKTAEMLKG